MTRLFLWLITILMMFLPYTQAGYNADDSSMYDKAYINDRFVGDIHGELMLFPDSIDDTDAVKYNVHLLTGLLDTDGHIVLVCRYDEEHFAAEISRLSSAECTMEVKGETLVQHVRYDEEMYYLPAYIAMDGFDSEYEYALIDESAKEIIYVYLSFPNVTEAVYHDYLKRDLSAYVTNDSLDGFCMYSFYFEDGKYWAEPDDFLMVK